MAFDEFCLEQLPLDEPVFYLWQNRPSVIIGLNQNAFGEVNLKFLEENGITLARRVTGGGAVYHDLQNLNYTIVGRSNDLERDYPGYMHMIIDALRGMGVDASLSGRNDIMVEGRKVSGYAKRVWKDRLMVHGTLMYDVDLETLTKVLATDGSKLETAGIASVRSRVANLKDYLPQCGSVSEMKDALHKILAGDDRGILLSNEQLEAVRGIAEEKFYTWEWVYGRSLKTGFQAKQKFACGTVEADVKVERGIIRSVSFGGDFIGNRPASELAEALAGASFEPSALLDTLRRLDTGQYFDNTSPDEIAKLICL